MPFAALGVVHQRLGPWIFPGRRQVKEQTTGQRIVFRGDQAVERQHGLGLTVDNGDGFGLAHIGQADKADALRVCADSV
ncbi:hypothetical protein D3C76_1433860 [compost metagenome]